MAFQTCAKPSRRGITWFSTFQIVVLCCGFVTWSESGLLSQEADVDKRATSIVLSLLKPAPVPFQHTVGSSGKRYVVEPMTAGLALFDYDGDGLIDIYFLNGAPLPGSPVVNPPPTNRLYRNLGGWRFVDVTESARVGDTGYGLGVVAGDVDNDGDQDIYVSNFAKDVFYINNADGTFTEAAGVCGLEDGGRFGAGVCMLDIDNDGNLDIYCANYQYFSFDKHFQQTIGDYQYHPGPHDFPPADDLLFRSLGDGTFTDVSATSGIASNQLLVWGLSLQILTAMELPIS